MDSGKATVLSVTIASVVIGSAVGFVAHLHYSDTNVNMQKNYVIRGKELEIGVYDKKIECIRTVMQESRNNSTSCGVAEAERICGNVEKKDVGKK